MKYILVIVAGLTLAQFFIPADGRSTGALIYSTIPRKRLSSCQTSTELELECQ